VGSLEDHLAGTDRVKPEKFRTGTANALKAHPEANCMFVASDFCFTAVQSALEDAGKWKPTGPPGHRWVAAQAVTRSAASPQGGYIDVATSYDAYYHTVELVKVLGKIAAGTGPRRQGIPGARPRRDPCHAQWDGAHVRGGIQAVTRGRASAPSRSNPRRIPPGSMGSPRALRATEDGGPVACGVAERSEAGTAGGLAAPKSRCLTRSPMSSPRFTREAKHR